MTEKQASRIAWLEHQLFGVKSEKEDPNQATLDLEGELGKPDPPLSEEDPAPEETNSKKEKRTRRTKAEIYNLDRLPKVIVAELIPEEVKQNPEAYKRIGEDFHDELDYQPASVQVARTILPKFALKKNPTAKISQSPAPECEVPKTMLTAAMATHLILDKHCDHLTHYRIAQRLKREFGIDVSDKTINSWVHLTADHLKPISQAIGDELRSSCVLQIDETPIKYLSKGAGQALNGYLWVMRDPSTKACYYHWETGRSLEALKTTLGYDLATNTLAFKGTIQCDGYRVYNSLKARFSGIELAGCFAHIRRKFIEDQSLKAHPWVVEVIGLIQELYKIERVLKKGKSPPDEVKVARQTYAKPITEQLHTIFQRELSQYRPQSNEGKALSYALGQWSSFLQYLKDGALEIDNNGVENAIRPTKLNLKNCLFFGNASAGGNNAALYTLIENCKAIGLNPRVYLETAIKEINHSLPADLTPCKIQQRLQNQAALVA